MRRTKFRQAAVPALILLSLLLTTSISFCTTSVYSRCLSSGQLHVLIWAELSASLTLPFAAAAFTRLSRWSPGVRVRVATFGTLAVTLMISSTILHYLPNQAIFLPIILLSRLQSAFCNVIFWDLATRTLANHKGKEQLGLVSAGFPLGWIIGGTVFAVAGGSLKTESWILLSGLVMVLGTVVLAVAERLSHTDRKTGTWNEEKCGDHADGSGAGGQVHALKPILALAAISVVSRRVLRYVCDSSTSLHCGTDIIVTRYVGLMDVVTGLLQFLFSAYVTDRILRRHGFKTVLVVLPVLMTIGAMVLLAALTLSASGTALLLITSITRVSDQVMRNSLQKPSFTQLYRTLSPTDCAPILSRVEMVVKPLSALIASVTLIGVTTYCGNRLIVTTSFATALLVISSAASVLLLSKVCVTTTQMGGGAEK